MAVDALDARRAVDGRRRKPRRMYASAHSSPDRLAVGSTTEFGRRLRSGFALNQWIAETARARPSARAVRLRACPTPPGGILAGTRPCRSLERDTPRTLLCSGAEWSAHRYRPRRAF